MRAQHAQKHLHPHHFSYTTITTPTKKRMKKKVNTKCKITKCFFFFGLFGIMIMMPAECAKCESTHTNTVFFCARTPSILFHIFCCCCLVLVVSRLLNLFMRINGDYHFDCRIKRCTQFATEHSIVSFFCAYFFLLNGRKKARLKR